MNTDLSADDVLEMALRIETDASAFYRNAASAASNPSCRGVLEDLATMESEHGEVFATMKAQPTPPPDVSPAKTGRKFPGLTITLASGVHDDLVERFTGRETDDEILRKAIVFEKDSIVFFLHMKSLLGSHLERGRIDALITEELGHVLNLTGQLTSPKM